MINDPEVREDVNIFQQMMLDILQRRAVWEALEQRAIGKNIDETTIRIYAADYVGSHLSDLRKFFENDGRSHKISSLTGRLPVGSKAKLEHDRLFKIWKNKYEDLANQYYFHRQNGYINPGAISKAELNTFIDEVNTFLDVLVEELTNAGFEVSYLERAMDSSYLQDIKKSADEFFGQL